MQPSRVPTENTITTTIIPPMIAPTITGVDESEEEMLTWMGDAMLVAFSIGVSGVTPLVAVTVMVYCTPGFRPAKCSHCMELLQTCIGLGRDGMAARLCHPTLACHFRQEYLAYPHLLSHKGTFYRGLA